MSHFRDAKFSGNVGTEPEVKTVGQNTVKEFVLFAQNRKKDGDTYVNVGENEAVRVSLWNEKASEEIHKGDLVEVTGSFSIERFVKRDGTPGIGLQTDFVSEVAVKYRKPQEAAAANGGSYAAAPTGF